MKKKLREGKIQKLSRSLMKFKYLLDEGLYSEFTSTDWIYYFQVKYEKTTNRPYILSSQLQYTKEHKIYKSIMNHYTPKDIKLMIDFIFDSSQDIMPKNQAGAFLLSSKWIDSIYRNAKLWETGEYLNRAEARQKQTQEQKDSEIKDRFKAREWRKSSDIDTESKIRI